MQVKNFTWFPQYLLQNVYVSSSLTLKSSFLPEAIAWWRKWRLVITIEDFEFTILSCTTKSFPDLCKVNHSSYASFFQQ